jgi:RNA polymerase sigma-70 factor (ECF subfamily)
MYCNGVEDKEDLFQDIVLQLWKAYPSYRGDSKISTWIYRLAINNAITRLRKVKRQKNFDALGEEAFAVPAMNDQPDEKLTLLYEAIKLLSDVERALTMLYLDSLSYKEIAEIMGITESNVGFKLNKIKTKLRTLVKN